MPTDPRGPAHRLLGPLALAAAVLLLVQAQGQAQPTAAPAASAAPASPASPAAPTPPAFDLITPAEAEANARAEATTAPPIGTRQAPAVRGTAPVIRVLSPEGPGTPVAAPLRIEAVFTPTPGTRIVPSSFRVLYGLLKIDLTERLRAHATINESGVVVDRANVPNGQHRLFLQVADDKGNTAEQELRIRVGAAS